MARWTPSLYLDLIRQYKDYSHREVERVENNLKGLSDDDKASLIWPPQEQIVGMKAAVSANLALLEGICELIRQAPEPSPEVLDIPQGVKPVQTLLQTFAREWSKPGTEERKNCFDKLLGALDGHLKDTVEKNKAAGVPPPRVLVPGANLGRIPFEVQQRGYSCSGCESRVLHYFGGEFVRKQCAEQEQHIIQPYVLNTCNRFKMQDHIRKTPVPEVAVEDGTLPAIQLGDFLHLYDKASELSAYDAVLTAFAVDTTCNIFRYVRTVAHVVRPGGMWANFGPLAYDTDHDEEHGRGVELSWEELRFAISHFFDIKEEGFVDAFIAANTESMMQIQYSCIYFKAVRNDVVSAGIGKA